MSFESLNLSAKSKHALQLLRLHTELAEKQQFQAHKSFDDLIRLLDFAQKCHTPAIQKALAEFQSTLSVSQHDLLNQYIGTTTSEQSQSPAGTKKTIFYRGQKLETTRSGSAEPIKKPHHNVSIAAN